MTMFRRVFSTHIDEQAKEPEPPKTAPEVREVAPAPPDLPPALKLHGKSSMTELAQLIPTGGDGDDDEDEDEAEGASVAVAVAPVTAEPDLSVAARAAEVHAQMLRRSVPAAPPPDVVVPEPETAAPEATPQPEHAPRRSGRARTRLLGFGAGADVVADPIVQARTGASAGPPIEARINPVGWVAITKGPGTGQHFALFGGVSMVGRGEDQGIRLDFGDQAISRQNHAALAYDPEDNKFYLGHGGKSNIIKLNGRPVLSTEEMFNGDTIRIGETTLRFVALCSADFQWGVSSDA